MPSVDECICCKLDRDCIKRLKECEDGIIMKELGEKLCVIEKKYTVKLNCITEVQALRDIIQNPHILLIFLGTLADVRGDAYKNNDDGLSYACYRMITRWLRGRLMKSDRHVLPSCIVTAIRNLYPDRSDGFTGFRY